MFDAFDLFDYSDAGVPNGDRATTTVAPQALFMMNSDLVAEAARDLAAELLEPARADDTRVSGPVIHENLAIYLVHGKSAPGPVPLTLEEALAKRAVRVHETGNVSEL